MEKTSPLAAQIAAMLATAAVPEVSRPQLNSMGYSDKVSVRELNAARRAEAARILLRDADPAYGRVGRLVWEALPKDASDGVLRTKVLSKVLLYGMQDVISKKTGQTIGRKKAMMRSSLGGKFNQDGMESCQLPFTNTGAGQILLSKISSNGSMKGHLVTAYVLMEEMADGNKVRTLVDIESHGPIRAEDIARLQINGSELASWNMAPPQLQQQQIG